MTSKKIPSHNKKKYIETRFWISITTDTHFVILVCQKCPPETAPAPGLFYKFWTKMPNPPMRLYCIARPRNFFQLFSPHFLCKSWNHFVQFKKYTWRSVAFQSVTSLKITLLHGCFSRFFKLYKWYQIAQSITHEKTTNIKTKPLENLITFFEKL